MTERDDLARVITENRSWVKTMSDGYLSGGQNTSEEIADAVLAAGWVSPAEAAVLREQRDEAAAKVRVAVHEAQGRLDRSWNRQIERALREADAPEDSMATDDDLLRYEGRAEAVEIVRDMLQLGGSDDA